MAKKKLPGHHCRVCGQRKANEKFSGKGHAAHICKTCAKLSPAERSAEQTLRKIEGMAMRHINDSEIKWLRKRLNDPRQEVQEAAREVHRLKFPRYERGQFQKGLTVFSLEFYLCGEVWDESDDDVSVRARVFADREGVFRLIDYISAQETQVTVPKNVAQKFLKSLIHEWEILFWDEDLSDDSSNDELLCSATLELSNGSNKEIAFYNQLHDEPQELYWALMDFFAPEFAEDLLH